jgi:hypothetical protein
MPPAIPPSSTHCPLVSQLDVCSSHLLCAPSSKPLREGTKVKEGHALGTVFQLHPAFILGEMRSPGNIFRDTGAQLRARSSEIPRCDMGQVTSSLLKTCPSVRQHSEQPHKAPAPVSQGEALETAPRHGSAHQCHCS